MNQTKRKLSEAGKKGQAKRMIAFTNKRNELLNELSSLTTKFWVDTVQFSRIRWSNDDISELIIKLRTKK